MIFKVDRVSVGCFLKDDPSLASCMSEKKRGKMPFANMFKCSSSHQPFVGRSGDVVSCFLAKNAAVFRFSHAPWSRFCPAGRALRILQSGGSMRLGDKAVKGRAPRSMKSSIFFEPNLHVLKFSFLVYAKCNFLSMLVVVFDVDRTLWIMHGAWVIFVWVVIFEKIVIISNCWSDCKKRGVNH